MSIPISADIVGILRDKRNRNFTLQNALLELIDNSIDAGATAVVVREQAGSLVIKDNGDGFKDINSSIRIGESLKDGQIGRYGVGLKDAALRFSQSTTIKSRGMSITVPWLDIITKSVSPEISNPEPVQDNGWTEIVFDGFRDRYSGAIQTDEIRRVYAPLLQAGDFEIDVNGDQLQPLQLPKFIESIDRTFTFLGKSARIVGGIFRPDDPMRREWKGYNPYYNGRLIGGGRITDMGVGDECCTCFSFQVHMMDGESEWHLSTNKDSSDELEKLLDHCYADFTSEILKRGSQKTQEIEVLETEREVSEASKIRSDPTGNRKNSPPKNHTGTAKATGNGPRKRRTFTATEPGDYENANGSHQRKSFDFKMETLSHAGLGEISDGKSRPVITFNLSNAWVSANKANASLIKPMAIMTYHTLAKVFSQDIAAIELVDGILDRVGEHLGSIQKRAEESK